MSEEVHKEVSAWISIKVLLHPSSTLHNIEMLIRTYVLTAPGRAQTGGLRGAVLHVLRRLGWLGWLGLSRCLLLRLRSR